VGLVVERIGNYEDLLRIVVSDKIDKRFSFDFRNGELVDRLKRRGLDSFAQRFLQCETPN